MLNADVPVPNVSKVCPTYGTRFASLLAVAAAQIQSSATIESTDFDVIQGEYPSSLENIDALIVSGSAKSAYDDLNWIRALDSYILNVYTNHPHVKIFGSCFGHQLVCQSLLGAYEAKVEQDPNGWEIGVKEIDLHDGFRRTLGNMSKAVRDKQHSVYSVPKKLRLQFVHHDHVVLPPKQCLPLPWILVGSTQHCAVQGVYEPGRVLTYQGHFEFDRFVNGETIKFFFHNKWDPAALDEALKAVDQDDDSGVAARMLLDFLLEGRGERGNAACELVGALLTPAEG